MDQIIICYSYLEVSKEMLIYANWQCRLREILIYMIYIPSLL